MHRLERFADANLRHVEARQGELDCTELVDVERVRGREATSHDVDIGDNVVADRVKRAHSGSDAVGVAPLKTHDDQRGKNARNGDRIELLLIASRRAQADLETFVGGGADNLNGSHLLRRRIDCQTAVVAKHHL